MGLILIFGAHMKVTEMIEKSNQEKNQV